MHRLFITRVFFCHLSPETLRLIFGVIEFAKAISDFTSANEKLESVSNKRIAIVAPGKR